MLVDVQANRRDPTQRIAFVKVPTKRFGTVSIPSYFDRNMELPPVGPAEVMITYVQSHRRSNESFLLSEIPKCLFLKVITFDDIKVNIEGFDTHGSQCVTTSKAVNVKDRHDKYDITPGRLMSHLVCLHNEGRHYFNKPSLPLIGGIGYIAMNPEKRKYRLIGIDDASMLMFTRDLAEYGEDEADAA
jgi:hypothetical protein